MLSEIMFRSYSQFICFERIYLPAVQAIDRFTITHHPWCCEWQHECHRNQESLTLGTTTSFRVDQYCLKLLNVMVVWDRLFQQASIFERTPNLLTRRSATVHLVAFHYILNTPTYHSLVNNSMLTVLQSACLPWIGVANTLIESTAKREAMRIFICMQEWFEGR